MPLERGVIVIDLTAVFSLSAPIWNPLYQIARKLKSGFVDFSSGSGVNLHRIHRCGAANSSFFKKSDVLWAGPPVFLQTQKRAVPAARFFAQFPMARKSPSPGRKRSLCGLPFKRERQAVLRAHPIHDLHHGDRLPGRDDAALRLARRDARHRLADLVLKAVHVERT